MFPSGPHRCNRAQENAGSEPAEMDVDDEVAPLLPLPVEKEESHFVAGYHGIPGAILTG